MCSFSFTFRELELKLSSLLKDHLPKSQFIPYIFLFGISSFLWVSALSLQKGHSILDHNYFDQHTRQAQAWLNGKISLDEAPTYLEIASFKGLNFNSFPPTPTLVELPFLLIFGAKTPSYVLLYLFSLIAIFSLYQLALAMSLTRFTAATVSLCFIFGTNIMVSTATGGVWAQGQVYGVCLVICALRLIRSRPPLAYLALSLAVGCRPFYLFYLPLFIVLDVAWANRQSREILKTIILCFCPYVLALGIYNWLRFQNPAEFGHTFLPWSKQLKDGLFSFAYFPRNFYHTLLKLPTIGGSKHFLEFDGRGNCFVINNPIIAIGICGLFSKYLKKEIRIVALLVLMTVWFGLLLHESNGWFQFGLRYIIDLAPISVLGVLALLEGYKLDRTIQILTIFSISINFYGIWWLSTSP